MTAADMRWFVDHYAAGVDPTDPRLSPLAAEDVSGAAPATIVLAECDPLRDEGVAYARMLEAAGIEVELREYPGQVHPFVLLAGVIDAGREARTWLARRLAAALRA
jgi:acetyl esterase